MLIRMYVCQNRREIINWTPLDERARGEGGGRKSMENERRVMLRVSLFAFIITTYERSKRFVATIFPPFCKNIFQPSHFSPLARSLLVRALYYSITRRSLTLGIFFPFRSCLRITPLPRCNAESYEWLLRGCRKMEFNLIWLISIALAARRCRREGSGVGAESTWLWWCDVVAEDIFSEWKATFSSWLIIPHCLSTTISLWQWVRVHFVVNWLLS